MAVGPFCAGMDDAVWAPARDRLRLDWGLVQTDYATIIIIIYTLSAAAAATAGWRSFSASFPSSLTLSLVQYWKMLGNQSAESPLVCVPSKSRPANQLHQPMLITSLTLDVCVSLSVSLGFSYRANL